MMNADKLIVALDVPTAVEARRCVDQLRGLAGMFKIGSQLFTSAGPELVREIVNGGERVFLDLKFHDIPNTVAAAGIEAARLNVSIFNVHAAGGSEMMKRTADAVSEVAMAEGLSRPAIIAVTVLTSANEATLGEVELNNEPARLVEQFSKLAESAGMDGVVASPREVAVVRSAVTSPHFLIVTPGVRPAGAEHNDQKRVTTPAQAISAGADYIVVGRPIIRAPDPSRVAQDILSEIEAVAAAAGLN
jgi:orotidine-5'-phosphate decarboxylase